MYMHAYTYTHIFFFVYSSIILHGFGHTVLHVIDILPKENVLSLVTYFRIMGIPWQVLYFSVCKYIKSDEILTNMTCPLVKVKHNLLSWQSLQWYQKSGGFPGYAWGSEHISDLFAWEEADHSVQTLVWLNKSHPTASSSQNHHHP